MGGLLGGLLAGLVIALAFLKYENHPKIRWTIRLVLLGIGAALLPQNSSNLGGLIAILMIYPLAFGLIGVVIDLIKNSINKKTAAPTNSPQVATEWSDSVSRKSEQPINKIPSPKKQGYELEIKKTSTPANEIFTSEKAVPEPLAEDWEKALIEFENGNQVKGLWAKIYADNNGDESISKAQYIKTRAVELAITRRKKISEDRGNMYAQASNELCIRNGALVQVQSSNNFPIYKLANSKFAIYANWKYKIYSDLDSLNKALQMQSTSEVSSLEGFIEEIEA
jgi:hypothetical protein